MLKAYPRASEPFILSEIYRLETLGIPLRLFATKPAEATDRLPRHPVVDLIRRQPEFLAPTASLSSMARPALAAPARAALRRRDRRVAVRHPLGMVRA